MSSQYLSTAPSPLCQAAGDCGWCAAFERLQRSRAPSAGRGNECGRPRGLTLWLIDRHCFMVNVFTEISNRGKEAARPVGRPETRRHACAFTKQPPP